MPFATRAGHALARNTLLRVASVVVCVAWCAQAMSAGDPIFDALTAAVGNRQFDVDPEQRMTDCSSFSIDYMDGHSENQNHDGSLWIGKWLLTWRQVPVGENYCIYLEKPERRGLTRDEAMVLIAATTVELPDEFKPWNPQEGCADPTSRFGQTIFPHLTENVDQGIGYYVGQSLVDFQGDPRWAPLDRMQREFARKHIDDVKRRPYRPKQPPPAPDIQTISLGRDEAPAIPYGTNLLGMSFEAHKAGALASMTVQWTDHVVGAQGPIEQFYSAWLLYVPTGQLLTIDDLFVDPDQARELIVAKARVNLTERWERMTVRGRTEAARSAERARVAEAVARTTTLDAGHRWLLSLDLVNPCKPGLLVVLEPQPAMELLSERAEVRLALTSVVAEGLKPQYLQAFLSAAVP